MTVFLASDHHFGHVNNLTYSNRPFATIEEHDEELIARHNAVVGPDDLVWVLGDVALGKIEESLAKCKRLNGRKILLCGNHDRPVSAKKPEQRREWMQRYVDEGGFTAVLVDPVTMIQLPGGPMILASHYPYAGDSHGEDRYQDRRPVDNGAWLVHGHVHGRYGAVHGRMIDVGVDAWNYEPVSAETIMEIIAIGEHE